MDNTPTKYPSLGAQRKLAMADGAARRVGASTSDSAPGSASALTDGELLAKFAARRDGAAFTELVCRHGPMVLRVCRRTLNHAQDAEDAFQATFVVLARRAGSLTDIRCLGSWLYGVASRVAWKARAKSQRRQVVEKAAPAASAATATGECDVQPVLDEELNRLPEKYRAPVVLHYLQGMTTEETASKLGWARGTVATRLSRARDVLRARLTRRGVVLSAAAFAAWFTQQTASAAVPATLTQATVQTATGTAAATGAAGAVALADATIRSLFLAKVKTALVGAGAAAVLCTAVVVVVNSVRERPTHLEGHDAGVLSIAFSPGDRWIATGSSDDSCRIWDRNTGKVTAIIPGRRRDVSEVAFSPDGNTLAIGCGDGLLKLWDVRGSKERVSIDTHLPMEGIASLAYSPTGDVLVTAGWDKTVKLWDPATGQLRSTLTEHTSGVCRVRFAPDGRFATSSNDGSVKLWSPTSTKSLQTFTGHSGPVTALAFHPDGQVIASGGRDGMIYVWDVSTRKPRRSFQAHPREILSLQFAPDGKTLVSGGHDGLVRLWDSATGNQQAELAAHTNGVASLAFTDHGKTLVTGSYDKIARFWDMTRISRTARSN